MCHPGLQLLLLLHFQSLGANTSVSSMTHPTKFGFSVPFISVYKKLTFDESPHKHQTLKAIRNPTCWMTRSSTPVSDVPGSYQA